MKKKNTIKTNILTVILLIVLTSCSHPKQDRKPNVTNTPIISSSTTTIEKTPVNTQTAFTPSPTPYFFDTPAPTESRTPVPVNKKIVNPYSIYNSGSLEFDVLELSKRYSDIVSVDVFGKSYMGKDLYVVKLGKGPIKFLFTGTTHARENLTTNYIMRTIEEYATAYIDNELYEGFNVREILNKVTIYYVPLVNPDGLDIVNLLKDPIDDPNKPVFKNRIDNHVRVTWKANGRGVDLNKNYPFYFDEVVKRNPKKNFSSMDYHGPYAASEPETYAMINLCESNDFQLCINLHNKGKIMYWRDEANGVVEGDEKLARIINKQTGYTMQPATVSPLSYGGGHENWFRYRFNKPAICLELTAGNDGPIPYNLVNRESYDNLKRYDFYEKRVLDWEKTKTLALLIARDYFKMK